MVEEFMRKPLSFLAILAIALLACKRGAPGGSKPSAMTESFASKNGLIAAHYPADFAASTVGTSSIVVSRGKVIGGLLHEFRLTDPPVAILVER